MSISLSRIVLVSLLACYLLAPALWRKPQDKIPENITDLSIGNSHARAINFRSMGLSGYNGYIDGSDIRQTIQRFYDLGADKSSVKRIWIPVAPIFLYRDLTLPRWARNSTPETISAIDFLNSLIVDLRHNISGWGALQDALRRFQSTFFSEDTAPKRQTILTEGAKAYFAQTTPGEIVRLADHSAQAHLSESSINNKLNIRRINKFLSNLESLGIITIFYTPPYSKEYYHHKSLEKFARNYHSQIQGILDNHKNAYYFDFHDIFTKNQTQYFYDDSHMNIYGAKAFSPILFKAARKDIHF